MTSSRWIDLAGAANVRDMGGLPTDDGQRTELKRLIRADNLQGLTEADVRVLLDVVEVEAEGPGPLVREPSVDVVHLSLFPEAGRNTDAGSLDDDAAVVLPWQNKGTDLGEPDRVRLGATGVYLRYLDERPDSVLGALRLIAASDGATIVHCAAGKDRTGTVIAVALAEVGVTREAIVEDYTQSAERIEAIFARLNASSTYRADLANQSIDKHRPRAATMEQFLDAVQTKYGGASDWLRAHGWTDDDAAALRKHLLSQSVFSGQAVEFLPG